MENVIYKQYGGDELLVIDTTTYEIKNLYNSKYYRRLSGNLIIAEKAGILLSEDGIKYNVDINDVIFVNYDFCFVIKNEELTKLIEEQIAQRLKRAEDRNLCSGVCDCGTKLSSN